MRRREFIFAVVGVTLAGCSQELSPAAPAPTAELPLIATPARNVWPPQYRQAPAAVQEAYAFALSHGALLTYIPCFCGCGGMGHRSNYDCFARSQKTPGTFVLDTHGFGCGTCVNVALESKALLAEGFSVKAIRQTIDAKWSSVGPATRTPLPQ
ncbi:MAG TPA: PCYCGC motif-containing (lipo)protein [Candidatus Limnocylindria bacterium]|jgi:hypothetical protein|nr:PCYCGC motif-containing (lipo)protein [Candidatus Limnocylindria bacterium]